MRSKDQWEHFTLNSITADIVGNCNKFFRFYCKTGCEVKCNKVPVSATSFAIIHCKSRFYCKTGCYNAFLEFAVHRLGSTGVHGWVVLRYTGWAVSPREGGVLRYTAWVVMQYKGWVAPGYTG